MSNGSELGDKLADLLKEVRAYRRTVGSESTTNISRKELRDQAHGLASTWRFGLRKELGLHPAFSEDLLARYDQLFEKLLKLSLGPNRRNTYLAVLEDVAKRFRKDLVIPAHTVAAESDEPTVWESFLEDLPEGIEGEYFRESIECAKANLLRSAAVMGWCACVDQIQRSLVGVGLNRFNKTSEQLAAKTKGRFKRFNKKFVVGSLSELRAQVFDDDLLVVVEGMGFIDNNQYRRLRACLDMRNQAAHPGEAPITPYNLMSFFSDIVEMVLNNPSFRS